MTNSYLKVGKGIRPTLANLQASLIICSHSCFCFNITYHPSHTLVNILSDILSFLDTFQITGEQGGERHPCSVLALQPKVIYPSSFYDNGDDDDDNDCNADDECRLSTQIVIFVNIIIDHLANLLISRDRPDFPSLAQTLERLPKKRLARFSNQTHLREA